MVEYHATIKALPLSERPRERLRDQGADSLSNSELLAILLRTGTATENALEIASRLLAYFGGLPGLMKTSFDELRSQHGMGEAKVAQIKAALELGKRLVSFQGEERVVVKSPADVARLLLSEMSYLEQEEMRVVLLNTKNHVMRVSSVYRGSVNKSIIRVGELFREAVRLNSPAIIVVHNHPSGDPTPSDDDIQVTGELVRAGKVLDIEVLDHLIVGEQNYVSLRERGLGFS
ncbi:MAG: DNA repair protein RadC [Chloroflexi bacterium]|nr:DNA repair protein RadC [Chloroflexota bacterium]